MPQVRNSLEPICGRVAETGDLTKPTNPWRICSTPGKFQNPDFNQRKEKKNKYSVATSV